MSEDYKWMRIMQRRFMISDHHVRDLYSELELALKTAQIGKFPVDSPQGKATFLEGVLREICEKKQRYLDKLKETDEPGEPKSDVELEKFANEIIAQCLRMAEKKGWKMEQFKYGQKNS